MTGERPSCQCHDLPMDWNLDSRYTAGGRFSCSERRRERQRAAYASMNGLAYNQVLLYNRRAKALARRRHREAASG